MEFNRSYILFLIFASCLGCKPGREELYVRNSLKLSVRKGSSLTDKKGIDSYAFEIKDNKGMVLRGELGEFVNTLAEPDFPVFNIRLRDSLFSRGKYSIDSNSVFFSETPEEDYVEKIFAKQYYLYDTINGIVAKLIIPKKVGVGITGIYVPRLRDGVSFSLYGQDLDILSQQYALEVFQTIKYLEEPSK